MIPRPACHVGPGDLRPVASPHMQAHMQANHSMRLQRLGHPQTVGKTPPHLAGPCQLSGPSSPIVTVRCNAWSAVASHGGSSCSNQPELPRWKGEKPLSLAELRQRGPRKSSDANIVMNGTTSTDVQEHPSCGSGFRCEQRHEPTNRAACPSEVAQVLREERAFHRAAHASVETLWRYDGGAGVAIGIRNIPKVDGPWTGKTLLPGDVFAVSQELEGTDGIRYLRLSDGSGWVFDCKPGEGILCVRHGIGFKEDSSKSAQVRGGQATGVHQNYAKTDLPVASSDASQTLAEDLESEREHSQPLEPATTEGDVCPDTKPASEVQDAVASPIVHENRLQAVGEGLQTVGMPPAAPEHHEHHIPGVELAHDSVSPPAGSQQTKDDAPSRFCSASPTAVSMSMPATHEQPQALLTGEVASKTCMPAQYAVGQIIEVLRSDGSFSSGEIKAVHLTGQGIRYDVRVDGGGVKLGVPDTILRTLPGQDQAVANLAVDGITLIHPSYGGTTTVAAAAGPAEAANCAQQSGLNAGTRPAAFGPTAEPPVPHSIPATLPGEPYRCLRVYLGTLEFQGCGAGLGLSGLFESSGYRARVHLGEQKQQGWNDEGAVTEKQPLKYSRVVSNGGKYTHRISCEFDEALDLPWPMEKHEKTAHVSVDLWLEKRTVVERLDSLLDTVGLGNDMPLFDRTWVGFMTAILPPQGQDTIPQPWPVKNACRFEGPKPKHLSLGVEWLVEAPELDDADPC